MEEKSEHKYTLAEDGYVPTTRPVAVFNLQVKFFDQPNKDGEDHVFFMDELGNNFIDTVCVTLGNEFLDEFLKGLRSDALPTDEDGYKNIRISAYLEPVAPGARDEALLIKFESMQHNDREISFTEKIDRITIPAFTEPQ